MPPGALDFRTQASRRKVEVAERGEQCWRKFVDGRQVASALPPVDLLRGDRSALIGLLVALHGVSWQDSFNEADRTWLMTELSGHACFVSADQPAMQTYFHAQGRYRAKVEPRVPQTMDLIGRVLPDLRLAVTGRGGTVVGLVIEVVALRVPGHFFIDLSGSGVRFAGEELLDEEVEVPAASALPGKVTQAMFSALKAGQEQTWRSLFADWLAVDGEPRPLYRPHQPYPLWSEDWTRARDLILNKVSDVRICWEGEPRTLMGGGEFPGAPRVEEVSVEVDHIERFGDEARVFSLVGLHRHWTLQRIDGGPWRIASRHGI